MRIIAGSARGRRLLTPKSEKIRPTADRVRESIFNVLGQTMEGRSVLDLFAGTGALSLEALSRGAERAVMVDDDREAVRLCKLNAGALGFEDRVRVLGTTVARALRLLEREDAHFSLVFADPPYAARAVSVLVDALSTSPLLLPGATFCVEHDKREPAPQTAGPLTRVDQRKFGDTVVSMYRLP